MNLGRGVSIPQGKGVTQNGEIWIPATPEKPVLQRSNNALSEMMPQTQTGEENWQDLLGIYTGVLQSGAPNGGPHKFNTNGLVGLNFAGCNKLQQNSNPNGVLGLHGLVQNSRDVAPAESYGRLPQNFGPVKSLEHGVQDVGTLQLRSLNQKAGSIGSYVQNSGEVIAPQKVDTLAELMGMRSAMRATVPNGSSYVVGEPSTFCPHSQGESSHTTYASTGAKLQQNHIFRATSDVGGNNLQQMPNSRLLVPCWYNYNLNLPPRLEAGESSSAERPLLLGPVTPEQQKQSKNYQIVQVPHLLIDETTTEEKCNQDNAVLSPQPKTLEREHNELSKLHTPDKETAAILTSPSDGGNGGIDLNKTPQQKPPKRKKHRPKVVIEGKPKRTPKPAAKLSPDGKPTAKRKYVRKNGIKNSTSPLADAVSAVEASNVGPAKKSCKRVLNFDLDNGVDKQSQGREIEYQAQNNEGSKLPFNLNLDSHNAEWSTELNGPSTSGAKEGQPNTYGKEIQRTQTAYNFVHSNKLPSQESIPLATIAPPPPTSKDHTLNIIARSLNMRNHSINRSSGENAYNQVHHRISGGLAKLVIQANTSEPNLDSRIQRTLQAMPQLLEDLVDVTEKRGSKREHAHTELRQPQTIGPMGSQLWSHSISDMGNCNRGSSNLLQNGLETAKKKKVEDKFHETSSSMPSGITTIEDFSGQIKCRRNENIPAQSSTMHQNGGGSTDSNIQEQGISRNSNDKSKKVTCDRHTNYPDFRHEFQQLQASSQVHLCAEQMAQKTSNLAKEQSTNSLTAVTYWNLESASQRDNKSIPTNEIINSPGHAAARRQAAGQTSSKKVPVADLFLQQKSKKSRSYGHSSKKVTGSQDDKRSLISIDDITNQMQDLQINNNGREIVQKEQSALVPYRGDGAIVPYEEFDLVKKRRPRPRVDLDPETNRLWNLLMGKEGSERAETMDADRQKWWEEERKVFRGRVDSFIARMHLVQGDRRFSKWKGSVVDSVIGVFLTQNVSDHLSSSAFMSLAAKFPLKSTTIRQPHCENGGSPSVEHHEVRITYPDGTTYDHKIIREPPYNHSSVTSTESSEYKAENLMKEKITFSINDHTRRTEEDVISSQSSSESFIFQACEDIRSSSGSNSEAEDGWNVSKNLGFPSVSEQVERIATLQQHQFQCMGSSLPNKRPLNGHQQLENPIYRQIPGPASSSNVYSYPFISKVPQHQTILSYSTNSWPNTSMGLEKWEADVLAFSGKERMSSLASTDFKITNGTGVEHAHANLGQSEEITCTAIQNEKPDFQPSAMSHAITNKQIELQSDLPDGSQSRNRQHFNKHRQGKPETFQQDSAILADPTRPAGALSKQPSGNWRHTDITLEPTEMRQVHSSSKPSDKTSATTSNARKRKAGKEKAEPFNWDTLRKQVQSKAGTRERSREAMDSLDYEALQNADVREISDTIKERGMNNMLADRMKGFLNRLVQDHGRIDLEWLRDVPPDKAKDYLLSIRGLGLKSVECVRLLTLHHLAFPVDTNVGRIAVRLGWVPLQPLPESLQLHLLELYPVLESIQKYLWPRLCKLDQETLYELHYQMITFGKVFCTKREPNCNACPMRGECRHFASAFASARLALPGPEERHIVSPAAAFSAKKGSDVIIKPMPLPPSEDNVERGTGLTRNCEPFIEEPTTPEPPTEVSEKDIEDAFYEDPDEIPVIKLNVEEFTTNLQSFMQQKMEIGEGDMSKALVALSPELASIPMPKLKHVSRLRTEHQVYELPDSHPLLKEMDRREPDDPSPYLLAIWSPGETADSVQPPESKCSSQEAGGLCNKRTCFSCNSTREAQAQTVRGTILIPCRTAMRGSFPLNGTYFQVNEVFADHESSLNPIDVPRSFLWNLPRRTVFFGTSVSTIFKGLSTEDIQYCFWKGFVCVRGFDQKTRAPRPLKARLHLPASKMAKQNE